MSDAMLFEGALPEKPAKLNAGALFCRRYESWLHQKYRITGKDKNAIKLLHEAWEAHEEATLSKKMDAYLNDDDAFVAKLGWPLWLFEQRQNKYQVSEGPSDQPVADEGKEADGDGIFDTLLKRGRDGEPAAP